MTASHHRESGSQLPLHRIGRKVAGLFAAFAVVLGGTSAVAGAFTGTGGGGAGRFATTFEARAVGDPSITSCPGLGPGGQKVGGRYGGTITIDGEEYAFNFTTLEALVDRSAGVGSAEGHWQLTDRRTGDVVGRGELIATVTADPPSELEPPDPDLELQGLLIGLLEPPDPDMPAQKLLGNVTVSITDGTRVTGAVGDPAGVSSTGLLLPAVKC